MRSSEYIFVHLIVYCAVKCTMSGLFILAKRLSSQHSLCERQGLTIQQKMDFSFRIFAYTL